MPLEVFGDYLATLGDRNEGLRQTCVRFGTEGEMNRTDRGRPAGTDLTDANQMAFAALKSAASTGRKVLLSFWPKPILTAATLLVALDCAVMSVSAGPVDVDLELVLAVDASGSMDVDEQRLQREGYARALRQPEVIRAIADGAYGRIALTYIEWGDPNQHLVIVPWTIVSTLSDASGFGDRIAAPPLKQPGGTSISSGLLFAAEQLHASGARSFRQVVDVSGDGPNNLGPAVDLTRDRLVREGITINGLPITLKDSEGFGSYPGRDPDSLLTYYKDCVIGGPGSFLITVDDPARFEIAIRRKLVLEISGLPARVMSAAEIVHTPRIDCQSGEKHIDPLDPGHPRTAR